MPWKKGFVKPEPLAFCGVFLVFLLLFFILVKSPPESEATLLEDFIPFIRKAAAPAFFYCMCYVWA